MNVMTWLCGILALSSSASAMTLYEKDLAILFPLQSDLHLEVLADDDNRLFQSSWLDQINSAFSKTSIGHTIQEENDVTDWKLVGVRMVPCSPLGTYPDQEIDTFCWPEIRQVWQPILKNVWIKWNVIRPFYADDRAIHALYDVQELGPESKSLVNDIRNTLKSHQGLDHIDLATRKKFISLRDRAVARFLTHLTQIRDATINEKEYQGLGYRPETYDKKSFEAFRSKLEILFHHLTPPSTLKALTAFSLPEGRTPAASDEWIFLAFHGENGHLVQDEIAVDLKGDSPLKITIGPSEMASMSRDDPSIYDLFDEVDHIEARLRDSLLLFQNDRARLKHIIADRRQILVPNTSCASCHKFNDLRFNLHNFSYLEDLAPNISPRTIKDVELDLIWLKAWQ